MENFIALVDKQKYLLQNAIKVLNRLSVTLFEQEVKKYRELLQKIGFKDSSLYFTDHCLNIRKKISNCFDGKLPGSNFHQTFIKTLQMGQIQKLKAKQEFNLICNYTKRKQNKIQGKDLYSLQCCKHLAIKTFKKTYQEVFDVLFGSENIEIENKAIKIDCIGGGPGSDLIGVISFMVQKGFKEFDCRIWDYNYEKWNLICQNYIEILKKQFKKYGKQINLKLQWKFIDISTPKIPSQIINSQFITCCWVLNEAPFCYQFWNNIGQFCQKAVIILIDGEINPIDNIQPAMKNRKNFINLQCNPRTVISYPK